MESLNPSVDAVELNSNLQTSIEHWRSGTLTKGSTSPDNSYHSIWVIARGPLPSEVFHTDIRA
ncbi:hypothetical protein SCLCIDRAFT_1209664 [Scleroderma citrinum Foug A]|uniref:Uncharacterized protein n=1 Tax=Scleroderma citrinum Foug A TaxID=1036808 RepID=A0A0C3A3L4_9AGAM|nr:hypothetical protein SCLCIDRAFT_1209664 [Scleroderma citrinum Foug A]